MKLYKYYWGNNPERLAMKGRTCIVIARGKMNSICIEFIDNNQRAIVSRYSVRQNA